MTSLGQHTESQPHSRSCIIHSKRKVIIALIFSIAMVIVAIRTVGRPILVEQNPDAARLGTAYVVGLLLYLFLRIKCKHERLWLGPALAAGALIFVTEFLQGLSGPAAVGMNALDLVLWVIATVVGVMLARSAFKRAATRGDPRAGERT